MKLQYRENISQFGNSYEWLRHTVCCKTMEDNFQKYVVEGCSSQDIVDFIQRTFNAICYGEQDRTYTEISYCPWCGEKVEYIKVDG